MKATSVQSLHPFPGNFTCPERPPSRRKRASVSVIAMKSDANRHDHKLVDENMVVLKMRIQELRIKEEQNGGAGRQSGWMEWEKKWYKNYDSDVYEAIGLLQVLVMKSRPSLVVGLVALLMLSASTSLVLVLSFLLRLGIAMH